MRTCGPVIWSSRSVKQRTKKVFKTIRQHFQQRVYNKRVIRKLKHERYSHCFLDTIWPRTNLIRRTCLLYLLLKTVGLHDVQNLLLTVRWLCAATAPSKVNYRVRQKSGRLTFFAVFPATVWNFNIKFYSFIYRNLYI